jgi:formylglycine-generating enzyme required for sulfatase activity
MRRWFLSYNSQDAQLAEALESELRRKDPGAAIFFAPTSLRPGAYWMPALAEEIAQATGFVLLVGSNGVGPWQTSEYYAAYDRRVKEPDFPVALMLLKGQPAPGLPFLRQLHWIVTADPGSEQSVAQLLAAGSDGDAPPGELWRHTAPYRGFAAMTEADADFFFGRGPETAKIVRALATAPNQLALLLGNSGVGKSSLAQAGVVAALMRQAWPEAEAEASWPPAFSDSRGWCFLKLRPGTEPVRALVEPFLRTWQFDAVDPARARLLSEWTGNLVAGLVGLRDLLDATEARYRNDLKQPAPPAFLLYIDQGEELYLRAEERQRRRFSELVAAGLDDRRLRAMMSLRADFFGELQKDEALHAAHRLIDVPPLRAAALRTVVERPADLLQARFESERLAEHIARRTAEDSAIDAGALPLLSYLLDDMWTRMVERGDGVLRLSAQAIDLAGVLADRAEAFLAAHPDSEEAIKRILTLKLATVRDDGEPARRLAPRSEFFDEEWRLIGELADHPNRLVVTAVPEGGEAYAEIAHEAVFRRWERLRGWIFEAREFLIWKTTLEADRRAWGAGRGALLIGRKLGQAQDWLDRRATDVEQPERDFISASRRAARWRRVRLCSMVVAAPAAVGLLAIFVWAGFVWWGVRQVEGEWAAQHEFVPIPAGCFNMGSSSVAGMPNFDPERYSTEGPVHHVCLKRFELARFPVTQVEWRDVMIFPNNPEPSHFKPDYLPAGTLNKERLPVEQVSWNETKRFLALMSFFGHSNYRLPTEAEYEYATHAGTSGRVYWPPEDTVCLHENTQDESRKKMDPENDFPGAVNCDDGFGGTAPVGYYLPNPWGLYDMLGNVVQWVEDCWVDFYNIHPALHDHLPPAPLDGTTTVTRPPCTTHGARGASWDTGPRGVRAWRRSQSEGDFRAQYLGFRVARDATP